MSEMKTYVATSKFEISSVDQQAIQFTKGKTVQFDGVRAVYEGTEYVLPKLAVAVRAKWLVEATGEEVAPHQRPSANISLRAATPEQRDTVFSGVTHMSEEERVVSTVQHRSNVLEDSRGQETARVAAPIRNSMEVLSDTNSDAMVVTGGFKTAAKNTTDMSKVNSQDLRKIASLADSPHADGQGTIPSSIEGAREAEGIRFQNENISERASGDMVQTPQPGQPSMPVGAEAGRVVGSIHDRGHRAVAAPPANDAAARAEALRQSRLQAIAATSQAVEPVEVPSDDDLDPKTKEGRYNVARIIHPELPDWDFKAHWTKKMELLKDVKDEVTVRAIYASESEAIKRRIVDEFDITL